MPPDQRDRVDEVLDQWRAERPDLSVEAMGTFGRLGRLHALASAAIAEVFVAHGLGVGEFDVLAALRRSGPPYAGMPAELSRSLMLSPAGMTSRLDRLEDAGWIRREPDPDDRRRLLIVLTDAGRALVDEVVPEHVANEERLLAGLSPRQRSALDDALRALLRTLEPD